MLKKLKDYIIGGLVVFGVVGLFAGFAQAYGPDENIRTDFSAIAEDLLPAADNTYDLGSPDFTWAELHVQDATIYSSLEVQGTNLFVGTSTSPIVTITQNSTGDILNLFDGATEVVTVLDGGNVGIGINNPVNVLHVFGGTSGASVDILKLENEFSSSNTETGLIFTGGGITWARLHTKVLGANTMLSFDTFNNADTLTLNQGNIGISTTTPATLLDIFSTATTTQTIDSNSATQGACLKLKDNDGGGYTYITALNGVLSASTISCE